MIVALKDGSAVLLPFGACFNKSAYANEHEPVVTYKTKDLSQFVYPDVIRFLEQAVKYGTVVKLLVNNDDGLLESGQFHRSHLEARVSSVCFVNPGHDLHHYLDENPGSLLIALPHMRLPGGHSARIAVLDRSEQTQGALASLSELEFLQAVRAVS